jgi:hypothetical protein
MAITRLQVFSNSAGTSVALGSAVVVGDLLIVVGNWASGYTAAGMTDTLGNVYTQVLSVHNTVNSYNDFLTFSCVVTVAGTPTISQSGTNGQRLAGAHYQGFVHNPTIISADANQAQGTGTAVNSGNVVASQNAEHFFCWFNDNGAHNPPDATPFTTLVGGSQIAEKDTLFVTPGGYSAGATVNFSTTLAASDSWSTQIFGFYDAPAGAGTTALNPLGIGATVNDTTGDQPRAGFTKIKSDHAHFLASIGRRQTKPGVFGVTSSTGSTTVLNDSTQAWIVNQFAGQTLTILTGTLAGVSKTITSNTATAITIPAFASAIASGVGYQVSSAPLTAGSDGFATAIGGTAPSTVIDTNQVGWSTNAWAGMGVTFLAGVFAGQCVPILSNSSNTLTLSIALPTAIAPGTPYVIGPLPIGNTMSSSVAATLATTQNNYAPTGWGPGINRLRLAAASGGSTITGLSATGFGDGNVVLLRNTSTADSITLSHLSGSSSAANQFSLSGAASLVIPKLANCFLVYDGPSSVWTTA